MSKTDSLTQAETQPRICAYPWLGDCGDGTYRNPILCADYSDPDVVRVGHDFWMTASSFNCSPGLPILHSTDLVNWTLVNYALRHVPNERYAAVQPGCGVWAPAIRFHAGKFWVFFPTPDEGIYVTTATDPRGQWSEPHLLQAGKGLIDPCPLWDDDGRAYLVHAYAGSRAGIKHRLRVCPMSPDGTRLLGEGQIVFHEPERHPTLEGPKFLKRDGWYYLLAPAGGVATGWQTALRAKSIFGPYEDKIVLHQGQTPVNGPHQGALVDTAAGEWWFLHFQDLGLYGRIVHLQPVQWRDGWPMMGNSNGNATPGEPVRQHRKPQLPPARMTALATSDEFSSSKLGLQWQWNANQRDDWFTLSARDGWLRLFAQPHRGELALCPNVLAQKFPAQTFQVETVVDLAGSALESEAGLAIIGRASAALSLLRKSGGMKLVWRADHSEKQADFAGTQLRARVAVTEGGICQFSYFVEGTWRAIGDAFPAQPGVWIGAKVGLFAMGDGYADFDYFRFEPLK